MRRVHLFEFEDFQWFPDIIRDGGTDFLGFILRLTRYYRPCIEPLEDLLEKTGYHQILDLCSGNGGPIKFVQERINPKWNVNYMLSDKYPNIPAYEILKQNSNNKIDYRKQPLDVLQMDIELEGVRTMFSAIHHFEPDEVKDIFENVIESKMPIGIFDSGDKYISTIIGILLFHPILFFFCTPFIRPFKMSRIIFTYIIPIIPLYTIWDGLVSILRLYKPEELLQIAKSADKHNLYEWNSGKLKNKIGFSVTYIIGIPK